VKLYEILHLISVYEKAVLNSCSDIVLKCCSNISDIPSFSSMFMSYKLQFALSSGGYKIPGPEKFIWNLLQIKYNCQRLLSVISCFLEISILYVFQVHLSLQRSASFWIKVFIAQELSEYNEVYIIECSRNNEMKAKLQAQWHT
jgi:hypothetical protein